ncbi:hypothetical protein ABL78_5362 [Leptomonas seymouri]|uniref:Uncharacterized protein n=1 Tax=Leptomonas seymouri TaxID=5684 RepID=C6K3V3_LEPSE|nr:conserved hypothetical protein [Leptomonas seymouri]KPI85587.1 hypothetical protein ABL78_5362 [Leptomonas seymouri]|eukprot:KPI85587.1 hypothetical protein ABL78_5362 [Leptomonas seymouri]
MNDYAAWRSHMLRGPSRSSLPRDDNAEFAAPRPPPPPPLPSALQASFPQSSSPSATTTCAASAIYGGYIDVTARLSEVLQDIAATERGQEKVWLNVQPCVLHTIKLLTAAVQSREARLRELESIVQQAQGCLDVLVRDREVKEERYRLDAAAHEAETLKLWKRVLSSEEQQQLPGASSTQPPETSMLEHRMRSLEHGLHRAQRQLQALVLQPPTKQRAARLSPSRSSSTESSATLSTKRDDTNSEVLSFASQPLDAARSLSRSPVTQLMLEEVHRLRQQWKHFLRTVPPAMVRSVAKGENNADSGPSHHANPDHKGSFHRVNKGYPSTPVLRDDGGPVLKQHAHPIEDEASRDTEAYGEDAHDWRREGKSSFCIMSPDTDRSENALPGLLLPSSGRRVRWYWAEGARSHHVSAASVSPPPSPSSAPQAQRSAQKSADPVLPWSEWHAFDGRTDCWYSLGTWATHRQQVRELQVKKLVEPSSCQQLEGHCRFGWMARTAELVSWTHPTRLEVQRGGIYEVKVCLVRHCASRFPSSYSVGRRDVEEGVLSLWIDGVAVSGLHECVSRTLLYAQSPSTKSPTRNRQSPPSPRARFARVSGAKQEDRSIPPYPRGYSPPQHTHMEEAYRALQRRPCCEPAQIYTHTAAACLYLPAGVTLQVRCRELHSTKAICEAFCELVYQV